MSVRPEENATIQSRRQKDARVSIECVRLRLNIERD